MAPIHDQSIRDSPTARADDRLLDDWLLDDWLGLAGYLAEAVNADDVTLDTALRIGRRGSGRERAPRCDAWPTSPPRSSATIHSSPSCCSRRWRKEHRPPKSRRRGAGSLLAGNHSPAGHRGTGTRAASMASVSFTSTWTITLLMEPVRGMWSRARTPKSASEQRADSRLGQRKARSAQHRGSPEEDACDV